MLQRIYFFHNRLMNQDMKLRIPFCLPVLNIKQIVCTEHPKRISSFFEVYLKFLLQSILVVMATCLMFIFVKLGIHYINAFAKLLSTSRLQNG